MLAPKRRTRRYPPKLFEGDVNFEELARSCDDFNGAQLKAVCVEAGMLALRREAEQVHYIPIPYKTVL